MLLALDILNSGFRVTVLYRKSKWFSRNAIVSVNRLLLTEDSDCWGAITGDEEGDGAIGISIPLSFASYVG
jgi:hypothetical protein